MLRKWRLIQVLLFKDRVGEFDYICFFMYLLGNRVRNGFNTRVFFIDNVSEGCLLWLRAHGRVC